MQLNPSSLGTKNHWDSLYSKEKQNFEEFGDEGEIWFGQDSVDKMVDWTLNHCPMDTSKAGPYILDIGTGNGILPICLVQEGYPAATVCGIDYSQGSIELAKQVAEAREIEGITFQVADFINDENKTIENMRKELGAGTESGWDLLTDKGTFDAMALSASSDGTHPIDLYPQRVEELLSPGGYFLITSCNFTEDEIKSHFTSKAPSLKYHSRVKHPAFTFGGKSGATYCTVAFQKEFPVNT